MILLATMKRQKNKMQKGCDAMNKKITAIVDGETKEYNPILEFESNENHKKYIIYGDLINKEIRVSYYEKENDIYKMTPITDKSEVEMCMNIVEEILNYE